MKLTLHLSLAALLVVLTGCGSISSRWRGDRGKAYPGVRMAAQSGTHYTTEGEWMAFIDVPLSAVVDTLFLPYDLSKGTPAAATGDRPSVARAQSLTSPKSSLAGGYRQHPYAP